MSRSRGGGRPFDRYTPGSDVGEMHRRSPDFLAGKITAPVFIAAGLKDVRVHGQADAMLDALMGAGHPAEVGGMEPAEMHGFYGEDAHLRLYTKMLAFFDKPIGTGTPGARGH